jgi:hypothetical protein
MKYSHRGWFGFCPVYVDKPWSESPTVCPRHPVLIPLMRLNVFIQRMAISACLIMNPEWTPTWKIKLTGTR